MVDNYVPIFNEIAAFDFFNSSQLYHDFSFILINCAATFMYFNFTVNVIINISSI